MKQGRLVLPKPFSLGLTLLCGQAFRWSWDGTGGFFFGVAGGAFWKLRQEGEVLHWECSREIVRGISPADWLTGYLRLEDPLVEWSRAWCRHAPLRRAWKGLAGLRLLRQEPWECAASFLFAQGLSVKVIRFAVEKLCRYWGAPIQEAPGFFDFPAPEVLAHADWKALRHCTNNYGARARRLIALAREVVSGDLDFTVLRKKPLSESRALLQGRPGFGRKITDCVLLFSLDQLEAFPVDRWVFRALCKGFPAFHGRRDRVHPTPRDMVAAEAFASGLFPVAKGLAGHYLFLDRRLREDAVLRRELAPFLSHKGTYFGAGGVKVSAA